MIYECVAIDNVTTVTNELRVLTTIVNKVISQTKFHREVVKWLSLVLIHKTEYRKKY